MALTLLIIDEDPSLVKSLERTFEFCGFHVFSTADGMDGAKKAIRHKPDLILVDPHLPSASGLAVLKNLKRSLVTRDIPLLIHTQTLSAAYEAFIKKSFTHWTLIQKPSDRENLLVHLLDLAGALSFHPMITPEGGIVASGDFKSLPDASDAPAASQRQKKTSSR